jgi:hypothetical protein
MSIKQKLKDHLIIIIIMVCVTIIAAASGIMMWTYDEPVSSIGAKQTEMKFSQPAETQALKYGEIFRKGDFYPIGFDKAGIGTPVSVLQAAYPSGFLTLSSYDVSLSTGPFSEVSFCHDRSGADPKVNEIKFSFRNLKARDHVRSQAFSAFGSKQAVSSAMGKIITWKMKGIQAEIQDSHYGVSLP